MAHCIDMAGKVCERLMVVAQGDNDKDGQAQWICICACGNMTQVRGGALRRKAVKSCGCLLREQAGLGLAKAGISTRFKVVHGLSRSKTYRAWSAMKDRCQNPRNKGFENYGGRGIKVCDRWHSFQNFYDDMGSPGPGLSLDRINVDGNYEPNNCRWTDRKTQQNNRRPMKRIDQFSTEELKQELSRRKPI